MKSFSNLGKSGFTLLELMVVVALVGLMTALVMANINYGNHSILLKNAAHEMVIQARQAQNLNITGAVGPIGKVPDNGYSLRVYAKNDTTRPNTLAVLANYSVEGEKLVGDYVELSDTVEITAPTIAGKTWYEIKFLPLNQGMEFVNSASVSDLQITLTNAKGDNLVFYANAYSGLIEVR